MIGQTTLGAGDIAFTGFQTDNPDKVSFVFLKDVAIGTKFFLTDKGWMMVGGFRTNEGVLSLTLTKTYVAGDQITLTDNGPWSAIDESNMSPGSVIEESGGGLNLATGGDQIIIFQGVLATPSVITAINTEGPWDSDATSSNTSSLPAGLIDGTSANSFSSTKENAVFCGDPSYNTTSGMATAVNNKDKWETSTTASLTIPKVDLVFCPTFAANAPGVAAITESSCTTFRGTQSGGTINAPTSNCPTGSTLHYSVDDAPFSTITPNYNQSTAQKIKTTCFCNDNNTITSDTFTVTTVPQLCPTCPTLSTTTPILPSITQSSCATFGGTQSGGTINAPTSNCPTGSTLHYSVDDAPFSTNSPTYNQSTALKIETACFCDADNSVTSDTSMVTTDPQSCPDCPVLTGINPTTFSITESICNTVMGMPMGGTIIASTIGCPSGSVLSYSVNDGAFSSVLPVYNQTTSIKVEATCICSATGTTTSDTIEVTTMPDQVCPATITGSSQNTLDFSDPCSCSDPLNCSEGTIYYFHDTLTITASSPGLKIGISSATDFFIGTCGMLIPATAITTDSIPETAIGSGIYKLEFWRPDGSTPIVSVIESGVITPIPSASFSPSCLLSSCPPPPAPIPTMGQWGILILGFLLLILGTIAIGSKKKDFFKISL